VTARVTVIIPTYRRPHMLARAVRSVLRQTYSDLVVCVYDNSSSDETESVVDALRAEDARIQYQRHGENIGSFANFVHGMERVATDFFSFLSDDDVIFPNFLATAVKELEQNPDAMMFAGSSLELSEDGTLQYAPVALWPREGRYDPPEGAQRMLGNRHPTWTSILFRRDVIKHIGLLDSGVGAPNDLDYELQVAAHFPIILSFTPCAAYVRHAQAGSQREDTSVVVGYERIAEKFGADSSLMPKVRAAMVSAIERQRRLKLAEIAVKSVVHGDDAVARDALSLLREHRTPLGSVLGIALTITMKFPFARGLLAVAESLRMQMRASRAARMSVKTSGYNKLQTDLIALTRR